MLGSGDTRVVAEDTTLADDLAVVARADAGLREGLVGDSRGREKGLFRELRSVAGEEIFLFWGFGHGSGPNLGDLGSSAEVTIAETTPDAA